MAYTSAGVIETRDGMIAAQSKKELLNKLANIDISVPHGTAGRETRHVESFAISYMLATLAEADLLEYPISLLKSECPDFVLRENNKKITGIEHTEVVAENDVRQMMLRHRGYGSKVAFMRHSIPGEKKKSQEELKSEIDENKSDGWYGDSVEKEWVEAMLHFTEKKIFSSKKAGYQIFAENALLIYDNWHVPCLDVGQALEWFSESCVKGGYTETFNDLYILTKNDLHRINRQGSEKIKLSQLWGEAN